MFDSYGMNELVQIVVYFRLRQIVLLTAMRS
jgi:hypothetical protein